MDKPVDVLFHNPFGEFTVTAPALSAPVPANCNDPETSTIAKVQAPLVISRSPPELIVNVFALARLSVVTEDVNLPAIVEAPVVVKEVPEAVITFDASSVRVPPVTVPEGKNEPLFPALVETFKLVKSFKVLPVPSVTVPPLINTAPVTEIIFATLCVILPGLVTVRAVSVIAPPLV